MILVLEAHKAHQVVLVLEAHKAHQVILVLEAHEGRQVILVLEAHKAHQVILVLEAHRAILVVHAHQVNQADQVVLQALQQKHACMCCQVNEPVVTTSSTESKLHNGLAPIVGYIMVSNTFLIYNAQLLNRCLVH